MTGFKVESSEKIILVRCPTAINGPTVREFTPAFAQLVRAGAPLIVFDWSQTQSVVVGFFRPIVLARQALLRAGRKMASFGMSADVLELLKRHGVDAVFNPMKSLSDVETAYSKKVVLEAKMDVRFISAFVTATVTTLQTQASMVAQPGKPVLVRESERSVPMEVDVAGVIPLSSPLLTGSVALCFPEKVLLAVYSNMLGEPTSILTPEVIDSAGELTNIIFGQAKRMLNDDGGHQIDKAIPMILHGQKLKVHQFGNGVTVTILFETEAGAFYLKVNADPRPR